MKTKQIIFAALFFIFSISLISAQDEISYNELAKNMLTKSLNVQKGEVVVVQGGTHNTDVFEAFVIEASKLGAIVVPRINSDKISRSLYENIPANYVGLYDNYLKEWLKLVDVIIFLPGNKDLKAVKKNISKENVDKVSKGNKEQTAIYLAAKFRGTFVPDFNNNLQVSKEKEKYVFKQSLLNAVTVDYSKIAQNALKLENLLKNSKKIEVSSPNGTKISFSVSGRDCYISDGVVSAKEKESEVFNNRWVGLPTGNIFVSAIEDSGKGKVVVSRDVTVWTDGVFVENVSFKVKKGRMQNIKMDKGEEGFMKLWNTYPDEINVISGLQIGLNPGIAISNKKTGRLDAQAEGMINLLSGNNSNRGGKVKSEKGGYFHPITNATVKIDGKVVVKDGKLTLD